MDGGGTMGGGGIAQDHIPIPTQDQHKQTEDTIKANPPTTSNNPGHMMGANTDDRINTTGEVPTDVTITSKPLQTLTKDPLAPKPALSQPDPLPMKPQTP